MSDAPPNIDEALLDRLVDGELPDAQRRRLLASLEDEPGGWRRCALAFLEAQSWRRTLSSFAQEAPVIARTPASGGRKPPVTPPVTPRPATWRSLSVAAGIMLAFTVGMVWPRGMHPVAGPGDVAATMAPEGPSVVEPSDESVPGAVPVVDPPGARWARQGAPPDDAVWLLVGGNGMPERRIRIPLVEATPVDEELGRHMRSLVPETYRRRLERSGYRVERRRRFAPIQFVGGQQMLVPVEDTRIVPVGQTVY